MNIFIDIETIPGQSEQIKQGLVRDAQAQKDSVKAPANYKDPDKINEYLQAKYKEILDGVEDAWKRTALDGGFGQLLMIGYAIDDDEPQVIWFDHKHQDAERHVLENFFAELRDLKPEDRPKFIGHNLVDFDLRFIWQRAIVLGVKPPSCLPFNPKPWDDSVFDTMTAWAGLKNRISMDRLCEIFGIDGKGEIDGSKVWDFVKDGRIEEVAEYCKQDIERTRAMFNRINFRG